jgi:hypothetical protein
MVGSTDENLIRRAAAHMAGAPAIRGYDFHLLADTTHRIIMKAWLCHSCLLAPS